MDGRIGIDVVLQRPHQAIGRRERVAARQGRAAGEQALMLLAIELDRAAQVVQVGEALGLVGPVVDVQGAGFLAGLRTRRPAKEVHGELLARDILTGTSADPNVVRILAPYVLEERHVLELGEALAELPP